MFEMKITAADAGEFRSKVDALFKAFVRLVPETMPVSGDAAPTPTPEVVDPAPEVVDPPKRPRGRPPKGETIEAKPEPEAPKPKQVDLEEAIAATAAPKAYTRDEARGIILDWLNTEVIGNESTHAEARRTLLAGLLKPFGADKLKDIPDERLGDLVAAVEAKRLA